MSLDSCNSIKQKEFQKESVAFLCCVVMSGAELLDIRCLLEIWSLLITQNEEFVLLRCHVRALVTSFQLAWTYWASNQLNWVKDLVLSKRICRSMTCLWKSSCTMNSLSISDPQMIPEFIWAFTRWVWHPNFLLFLLRFSSIGSFWQWLDELFFDRNRFWWIEMAWSR